MARVKVSRERKSECFNAVKVIIAPEGVSTEVDYFEGVIKYFIEYKGSVSKRFEQLIDICVIKRGSQENTEEEAKWAIGRSAPSAVVDYATQYIERVHPEFDKNIDKVFVVVDKDKWEDKGLSDALTLCKQKGFEMVISNPAFELWLLLHYVDVSELSAAEKDKIKDNKKESPKDSEAYLKVFLKGYIEGFSYKNIDPNDFLPKTIIALDNAYKLTTPEEGWEGGPFTQLPKVIQFLPAIQS